MSNKEHSFDTKVIHAGQTPDAWLNSTLAPVFQSAAHRFPDAEGLSRVFAGKEPGHIYMRLRNPTNEALERRVSALEGAIGAVATSSGMAAITDAVLAILKAGDHIVAGNSLFMSTYLLFTQVIKKFGIEVTLVDPMKPEEWKKAVKPSTRLFFAETIGNPVMDVPDLARLAAVAHDAGCPLVVDNTLATPWLCRPLDLGADIVVHSTTKFLNGHGSAVGGIILDSGKFGWPDDRYADFKPFKDRAGARAFLDRVWREIHINFGTSAAPWHSYLTLIGIDTLALRMERHCRNAEALAVWLKAHPKVKWVNYPGLPDHPAHPVARSQFKGLGFGGLLTFGLADEKACFELIRRLKLVYHLANLGDCKTLIIHPWSSQYVSFPEDRRRALNIFPDLLRVSVGIEAIDDIIGDFDQALSQL
ncbi:MAG TPA: aminotransferase class V-fold PLP-dependent enzyme [bacterium]|nr:aminotransferase class V-fold PLP-dependent enzyme [bacterium]